MQKISEISGISSSVGDPLVALQDQLARYTQTAYNLSIQARASYEALQGAIKFGNVPAAQMALDDLQRESNPASSSGPQQPGPIPSPTTALATLGSASNGSADGKVNPAIPGTLDTVA